MLSMNTKVRESALAQGRVGRGGKFTSDMSPVMHIKVSLEQLVEFAERAVIDYNKAAAKSKVVEKTFKRCGQHIWDDDLGPFKAHLAGLKKDSLYRALRLSNQHEELSLVLN